MGGGEVLDPKLALKPKNMLLQRFCGNVRYARIIYDFNSLNRRSAEHVLLWETVTGSSSIY